MCPATRSSAGTAKTARATARSARTSWRKREDDIRLEVVFDNWGRTISTYTTNTDITRILGSSAASYTDTAERSKQNNRLTSVGSTGMTAENLLRDGGLESEDGWTNASTGSGSAAAARRSRTKKTAATARAA